MPKALNDIIAATAIIYRDNDTAMGIITFESLLLINIKQSIFTGKRSAPLTMKKGRCLVR